MARAKLGPELSRAAQLMQSGRPREAQAICQKVLKKNPRDVDAHHMLGLIESMVGRFDVAVRHFERGLRIRPKHGALLCGLAKARTTLGQYDEAIDAYDRALAVDDAYAPALTGKADTLERQGRFDEARALLEPTIAAGTEDGETAFIYATLLQRSGDDEAVVALVEKHLAVPKLSEITRRKLLYGIGKSYDVLGRHEEAFDAFRRANEIFRQPFSIAAQRQRFDRMRRVFAKDRVPALPRSTNDSDVPIFVVSMPRSGSTLVEQILASHPEVDGVGETEEMLKRVRELTKEVPGSEYPEAVERLDVKSADRLASRYLGRVRALARPGAARIIDKNLQNFWLLGLIQVLLPKARVIWCRRNPMSVCFSCYMLPLSSVALPYTTDLRHLGQYHRAYEELMAHWQDALEIPILEVHYEKLVADQEGVSRAIVEFAGLPWDDACLRFHETKRDVSTASYDQVRRPIYTQALKRYEHYAAHLGPLREGLGLT